MPFLQTQKKLARASRRKEESTYKNGLRHLIFVGPGLKDRYKGDWKDDVRKGKGAMLGQQGYLYEGDWENGRRHGFGILSELDKDDNPDINYYGFWVNGKRQGFGASYRHGNYYEGYWFDDKRYGYGKIWYKNGSFYEGQWEDDKYEGYGRFIYANANRYEGYWSKGLKHGTGCFYHVVSGQAQRGFWIYGSAVLSELYDLAWRQSAKKPSPYPIPMLMFLEVKKALLTWEERVIMDRFFAIPPEPYHPEGKPNIM